MLFRSHIKEPVAVHCALASIQCTGGPGTFALQIPASRVAGYNLKLADSAIALRRAELVGTSWNAQGVVNMTGVTVGPLPLAVPPTNWRAEFSANQAGVKAEVHGHLPSGERVVTAKVEQAFAEGKGSLRGSLGPLQFNAKERRLRTRSNPTGFPRPHRRTTRGDGGSGLDDCCVVHQVRSRERVDGALVAPGGSVQIGRAHV